MNRHVYSVEKLMMLLTIKARIYASSAWRILKMADKEAFWKGYTAGTLVMLVLHFLWIIKGGC